MAGGELRGVMGERAVSDEELHTLGGGGAAARCTSRPSLSPSSLG